MLARPALKPRGDWMLVARGARGFMAKTKATLFAPFRCSRSAFNCVIYFLLVFSHNTLYASLYLLASNFLLPQNRLKAMDSWWNPCWPLFHSSINNYSESLQVDFLRGNHWKMITPSVKMFVYKRVSNKVLSLDEGKVSLRRVQLH